mgnify:CR=1 FL=1
MIDNMNRLAIIVLNWNGADDALNCVESLQQQTLRPEIIIVDNNSSDDSVERFEDHVKSQKKDAPILIKNSQNLGFAGGINTGLVYAKEHNFEYIGVLNPDAIADKHWLKSLYTELTSHPSAGIATGLLLRRDGNTIDTSGDFYTTWGLPGPRNRDEPTVNAPNQPGEIFGATGGGALYRTAMLNDIGLFDEDFFMYYEDVDLSFRAQLAGWKVRYTPKAIAYHKVGASSQKVPGLAVFNTFKNLPLVLIKNVPGRLFWTIGARFFLTYWLIFASAIRHGNGWPALRGIFASLIRQPRAWVHRVKIQRNRKASIKYIRSIIHDGPLPNQTGLLKFRKFFTGK